MEDCIPTIHRRARRVSAAGLCRSVAAGAARVADTLLVWLERQRERRRLAELNVHLLKDIGISRADAEREAGKPFWRA